jgi:hypothetical protein
MSFAARTPGGGLMVNFVMTAGDSGSRTGYADPGAGSIGSVSPDPVGLTVGQLRSLFHDSAVGPFLNVETSISLPANITAVDVYQNDVFVLRVGRFMGGNGYFTGLIPNPFTSGATTNIRLEFV